MRPSLASSRVIDAIATLLEAQVGYCVELFGMLEIRNLEDGTFVLERRDVRDNTLWERVFTDAREAAAQFEAARRADELGHDFEVEA